MLLYLPDNLIIQGGSESNSSAIHFHVFPTSKQNKFAVMNLVGFLPFGYNA